ncbi:MAG: hypothetical protein AAFX81_01720 [Pseudomonadota bacterium]
MTNVAANDRHRRAALLQWVADELRHAPELNRDQGARTLATALDHLAASLLVGATGIQLASE